MNGIMCKWPAWAAALTAVVCASMAGRALPRAAPRARAQSAMQVSNDAARDAPATEDTPLPALAAIEKGFFEAWKSGHPEYFEQHIADGGIFFGEYGVTGKKETVQSQRDTVGRCDVNSYQLRDFEVITMTADTAVLTYRAEQHGTCYGTAFNPAMNGLSVYARRGGKWLNVVRSEVPAKNGK